MCAEIVFVLRVGAVFLCAEGQKIRGMGMRWGRKDADRIEGKVHDIYTPSLGTTTHNIALELMHSLDSDFFFSAI
jgi:hypothetical protein